VDDGKLDRVGEGFVITFEREIAHPIETVWAAITESTRLDDWLSADPSEIELHVGGRVRLGNEVESTVLALDPPRLIEYGWKSKDWDGGTVRWELEPNGDGTRLVLIHNNPVLDAEGVRAQREFVENWTDPYSPTLAGWHTILDHLAGWLDGTASGTVMGQTSPHWEKLHEHYKERTRNG
jgi:uncharacterized protein YndB with AHSA1/START domain